MQREVPSPIDFEDFAQARAWVASTVERRPWRPRFFEAFADALNRHSRNPVRLAELGSGPGHLARVILDRCKIRSYGAIDLSAAMHELAREHLGALQHRVNFIQRDFRSDHWSAALGPLDAIVTMQAAHEVRHKTRQPDLLRAVHNAIKPGGLLLFCDHYAEPGSTKDPDLYFARDEQAGLLERTGFKDVTLLLEEGSMALYQARA